MAEHDTRSSIGLDVVGTDASTTAAPGKRSASERLPLQRRGLAPTATASPAATAAAPLDDPFGFHLPVQRKAGGAPTDDGVHEAAARGVEGAGSSLPHLDRIQASFGHHDVSGVQAFVGGPAAGASAAMGAEAYATGNSVAFAAQPGLHTAAHEAAHVVQQRAGVQLKGGVGREGDTYERAADRVADAVVAGQSAAALLDEQAGGVAGGARTQRKAVGDAVQLKFSQTVTTIQDHHFGGVKSQYESPVNLVEVHIESGANDNGTMMQDFLMALWEASEAVTAGQTRAPGGLFMRPGGAQVLKMTMEMLGETFGGGDSLTQARGVKKQRQKENLPITAGNDTLDGTIVPEHKEYRNSMIGAQNVTIAPIGGGTSGGSVNMLEDSDEGAAERRLYDEAMFGLKPLMGLSVTVTLAGLNAIIAMMESKMTWLQKAGLKLKYKTR